MDEPKNAGVTQPLLLTGGAVYTRPGEPPLRDAAVLIDGGEIVSVGPPAHSNAHVLDCTGCSIFAGFWNCHVHFFERKWANAAEIPAEELAAQLQEFARFGFTSVFDLSSDLRNTKALRERIASGEVPGPTIRTAGEGLVPPEAMPADAVLRVLGMMPAPMPVVQTPDEARDACGKLVAAGVDAVKLFASSNSGASLLSEEVMRAVCETAHAAGKPVFVHPNTEDDVMRALRAGVDIIAHTTPRASAWKEELFGLARERNAALIPTLRVWHELLRHDRRSLQDQMTANALGQLRAWQQAGLTLLFGTDAGAVDENPAEEYALTAQAGVPFHAILASLTTGPAKRFARGEALGEIAPGFRADITVVNGDPTEDLVRLADVRYTVAGGAVLYR